MRTENLSDSRGGALGIRIFLVLLRILGVNRTCELVWPVTFFYVCFDRKARQAALPYLRHRFPEAGPIRLFFHTWALFTSQGQAIVERAVMTRNMASYRFVNRELSERLMDRKEGFLILTSHFGAWNAIMGGLHIVRKPVNLLIMPDRNIHVDKTAALKGLQVPLHLISTESPMGGLLDVTDAIERGEIVCLMGDRCLEGEGIETEFLGENALFPSAAFHIASRTGCAILALFAVREKRHTHFIAEYGPEIHPQWQGRDRRKLKKYLDLYVKRLEQLCMEHPYQCFLFENIWEKPANRNELHKKRSILHRTGSLPDDSRTDRRDRNATGAVP